MYVYVHRDRDSLVFYVDDPKVPDQVEEDRFHPAIGGTLDSSNVRVPPRCRDEVRASMRQSSGCREEHWALEGPVAELQQISSKILTLSGQYRAI